MIIHAKRYAKKGWQVFPCNSDKTPKLPNGFLGATTSERLIEQWWARDPDALIGVAIPAHHIVVDIDPRNGGDENWLIWTRHNNWPQFGTLTAVTGAAGTHLWYEMSRTVDVSRLRTTVCAGVDLKRPGRGYVVVPPSVSDFGAYEWSSNRRPAYLAPRFTDLLKRPVQASYDVVEPTEVDAPELPRYLNGTDYGLRAMDLIYERIVSARNGERNNVLFSHACQAARLVAGRQLNENYAADRLYEAGREVGLTDFEVRRTCHSGYAAGITEPHVPKGVNA